MGLSKAQSWAAIGVGAAGLVVFGLWLGRSAAEPAQPAAAKAPEAAPAPPAAAAQAAPPKRFHAAMPAPHANGRGLASDLVDADPRVRRAALAEAVRTGAADPQMLLASSHDGDLGVAFTATEALGKAYADGQVSSKELIALGANHANEEKVRVAALDGLGVVASPEAAALFTDLLQHGDVTERRTAAILLRHQDDDTAIPALAAALADPDEWVRANALESLRSRARGRDFGMDANAWRSWWYRQPR